MLKPFITSNPENKSLVTEVIFSKLLEKLFLSTTNFFESALGITKPNVPNIDINITIAGLMENKNIIEIVKDIKDEITWKILFSRLSSIIFKSL